MAAKLYPSNGSQIRASESPYLSAPLLACNGRRRRAKRGFAAAYGRRPQRSMGGHTSRGTVAWPARLARVESGTSQTGERPTPVPVASADFHQC